MTIVHSFYIYTIVTNFVTEFSHFLPSIPFKLLWLLLPIHILLSLNTLAFLSIKKFKINDFILPMFILLPPLFVHIVPIFAYVFPFYLNNFF